MGFLLFDQYTYLHFCNGSIAFYFGCPLYIWIILHTLFEIIENNKYGVKLLNKIPFWPGGKSKNDTFINSVGDTIGTILGWITAYLIDKLANKYGLYREMKK